MSDEQDEINRKNKDFEYTVDIPEINYKILGNKVHNHRKKLKTVLEPGLTEEQILEKLLGPCAECEAKNSYMTKLEEQRQTDALNKWNEEHGINELINQIYRYKNDRTNLQTSRQNLQ